MSFNEENMTICSDLYRKLGAHAACDYRGIKGVKFAVWAPNAAEVELTMWNTTAAANPIASKLMSQLFGRIRMEHPTKTQTKEYGPMAGEIWETFVPSVKEGMAYQYIITTADGKEIRKSDPFAYRTALRPENYSILGKPFEEYKWQDASWQEEKRNNVSELSPQRANVNRPMAVYEVHPGSWKKNADGSFYTYVQLADELSEYISGMGYTHVELLGICEYPLDASWGYQVTGYYAPTSRYGTPEQFKYFVDTMHKKGIGVILDWVPAHFPKDAYGLYRFDGGVCYEYADEKLAQNPLWGTVMFDLGSPKVRSFLISGAAFWADIYHIDGIRVDAVSTMLYWDCTKPFAPQGLTRFNHEGVEESGNDERPEGLDSGEDSNTAQEGDETPTAVLNAEADGDGEKSEDAPDAEAGTEQESNESKQPEESELNGLQKASVGFLTQMNQVIHRDFPGVYTIAEESSSFCGVTGELGFDLKWNMGWMHDFLEYMQTKPVLRKTKHNKLTFSLCYDSTENFLLPLSHDEVVHLKKPMLYKMAGKQEDLTRFAELRAAYAYMFFHPGKKLMFMGDEFAVRKEWNYSESLDWGLLNAEEGRGREETLHLQMKKYVGDLLKLYRQYPVLWAYDDRQQYDTFDSFNWLDPKDEEHSIYSFTRWHSKEEELVVALSFAATDAFDYELKVP